MHNIWYPLTVETALTVLLPNKMHIRLIAAPVFLATKLEAFYGRGNNDFMASHDLEDLTIVIDGRESILDEISASPIALRSYLSAQFSKLLQTRDFVDALPGQLPADRGSQARLPGLKNKLKTIAGLL